MSESPLITVSKAARKLGRDPRTVRGVAIGLGVELIPVATGLTMTLDDFELVKSRLRKVEPEAVTVAS